MEICTAVTKLRWLQIVKLWAHKQVAAASSFGALVWDVRTLAAAGPISAGQIAIREAAAAQTNTRRQMHAGASNSDGPPRVRQPEKAKRNHKASAR